MTALIWRFLTLGLALAGLAACGPSYSPDTYASNAVQQANKVEQGTLIGVRNVGVSASGTVGTVTGAAAGGIAGSQVLPGPASAFTALGGSLVGGIAGSTVEHVTSDTAAFEYIVRKANGELVSVTQHDKTPLALGQKVLVISGNQARVVPDYTVPPDISTAKATEAPKPVQAAKPAGAPKAPDVNQPPEAATPPDPAKPTEAATPPDQVKDPAKPADAATPSDAPKPSDAAKTPDAATPADAPKAADAAGSPATANSPDTARPAEPVQSNASVIPGASPVQEPSAAGPAPAKQLEPAKP